MDNYDTLITKAALHGAKLLKKSHQSTAVALASHLWWQERDAGTANPTGAEGNKEKEKNVVVSEKVAAKDEESVVKAVSCLRYSLRAFAHGLIIWTSSIPTKTASVCWSVCKSRFA